MGIIELLALGIALGVDTLSVSLGLGISGPSSRTMLQLGSMFALIASMLVSLGFVAAVTLRDALAFIVRRIHVPMLMHISPEQIQEQAQVVLSLLAGAIMFGIGCQLLLTKAEISTSSKPFSARGMFGLLWLATLVSIDALSAGMSLGMLHGTRLSHAAVIVGVVNGGMSLCGLGIGRQLQGVVSRDLRWVGGVILTCLGLRFMVSFLL